MPTGSAGSLYIRNRRGHDREAAPPLCPTARRVEATRPEKGSTADRLKRVKEHMVTVFRPYLKGMKKNLLVLTETRFKEQLLPLLRYCVWLLLPKKTKKTPLNRKGSNKNKIEL